MGLAIRRGNAPQPPVVLTTLDPATVPFTVVGSAGQTADLLDVRTNGGLHAFRVSGDTTTPLVSTEGHMRVSGKSTVAEEPSLTVGGAPLLFGYPAGSVNVQFVNDTGRYTTLVLGKDNTRYLYLEHDDTTNVNSIGGPGTVPLKLAPNGGDLYFSVAGGKIGLYGVAPVVRAAAITPSSVAAATNIAPFGYATAAQADAIPTRINAIITALQNIGVTL